MSLIARFTTTTLVIVSLGVLVMAIAVPTSGTEQLHLQMNEEELKQVFHAEPHAVPDYEVVSLRWPRVHKRESYSGTRMRLNAFGKNINLWLHPTEGTLAAYDTPVYLARSANASTAGVRFYKMPAPMTVVGKMFEDREKQATLIVTRTKKGRNLISGNVGSQGWVLSPLPQRFKTDLNFGRFGRWIDSSNVTIREYDEPHLHVIFRNPELPEEAQYIKKPIEDNILENNISGSKRSASAGILYPQILVVADYETYKLHGENVNRLLEYLLPFWNGVDLRYRALEHPKIRLNIAGIVVAVDPNALSYVTKNKVGSKTLNIMGALSDFGEYMPSVASTFPSSSYDIAVTMAPFGMCSPGNNGVCTVGILGLAYVSGACRIIEHPIPKTFSVLMMQDKGGFDGMDTAAHELGHLFGATHDGQGESLCRHEAGHIMASTPVFTENSKDWSRCTLAEFNKFFNFDKPVCLFDKPKTSSPLPRVLPGRILTMDEQCAKLEGTRHCNINHNPCIRLSCMSKENNNFCKYMGNAAADGSKCGDNMICVHGKCLKETDIV